MEKLFHNECIHIMKYLHSKRIVIGKRSFTLIELLVAIGIVAVLSTVTVVALNPAELFKQARDSSRIASLETLEKAITIYQTERGFGGIGTANILYISLPDDLDTTLPLDDCSGIAGSLPALPSTPLWEYHCVTTANLRKTDSNGWIPINFGATGGLSALPVDPINKIDSTSPIQSYFYTYAAESGGEFEINAKMESVKYGIGGQ